tara:strand:+ start:230 stop:391 length:162 start_codon:yes stop_codon:yes gene_type:complete
MFSVFLLTKNELKYHEISSDGCSIRFILLFNLLFSLDAPELQSAKPEWFMEKL